MERIADELVGNPFISPEIIDPKFVINMPVDAITSLRSIYATTPFFAWNLVEQIGQDVTISRILMRHY
ncbi:MAG: hypothetical protein VB140_04385 [Burkholderia sp.]|nr:MAG: hypothetical protein E5299_01162 [Burkholderia gladioli]